MPLSPGAITPRDMNPREWATYVAQSGIQADRRGKAFTPQWSGFSVNPTGDLSYMDFGAIVILWADARTTGTSNDSGMTITNLPAAITPSGERLVTSFVVNNDLSVGGAAGIHPTGSIDFALQVPNTADATIDIGFVSFEATGFKGLPEGWILIYAK